MARIPLRLRVWAPLAALGLLGVGLLASPLATAWRCYELHARGERAATHVVGKDPAVGLVLEIDSGSLAGSHCTAHTSDAHLASVEQGERLEVVLPEARPGECVLVATLENSAALLWGISGSVVVLLLMLLLVGLLLVRSFERPGAPSTRFDLSGVACPRCRTPMREGYLPLLAGVHWRELGQPVGLPHALAGLPGTTGWRGRPCLHAYRCQACEIVTFRYGKRG